MRRLHVLAFVSSLGVGMAAMAASAAEKVVIGDIDDMSGPYADVTGAERRRSGQDGDRRLRRLRPRPADRAADLRPPEQARPRRTEGARMGRPERPDDAARRLQHRRQPGDERRDQREEGAVLRHRRRRRVADRQGLHALHDPLRLRHDRARQRHGAARSSNRAASRGSSSPPTTPSARSCKTPRPTS